MPVKSKNASKPKAKQVAVKKAVKPVKKTTKQPVKKTVKPVAKKPAAPVKKVVKPVVKKKVVVKKTVKPVKPVLKKKVVVKKTVKPVKKVVKPVVKKKPVAKKIVKAPVKKKIVIKKAVKPVKKIQKAPVKQIKKIQPVKKIEKKVIKAPEKKLIVKHETKIKIQEVKMKEVKKELKVKPEVITAPEKKKTKLTLKEKAEEKLKNNNEAIIVTHLEKTDAEIKAETAIEKKLKALYTLQQYDSEIDRIRILRGELPLEVQDIEDEVAGLHTRIENYNAELDALKKQVTEKKIMIKDAQALIKKYESQQANVKNNREYDSLSKEMEFQTLEIQLAEKRISEHQGALDEMKQSVDRAKKVLAERSEDLKIKKDELDEITSENEKEEKDLIKKSIENQKFIEERFLSAYIKIRKNARNGLAVVQVERDACGGCFNKIPPQRQMEIRMHRKIIVCEYCGRILVDDSISDAVKETLSKKK